MTHKSMKDKEALIKEVENIANEFVDEYFGLHHRKEYTEKLNKIINLCATYQDEWISVEDRLPERKGQYDVYNGIRRITDHWFNGKYFINPIVTHWRERPQPPTSNDCT